MTIIINNKRRSIGDDVVLTLTKKPKETQSDVLEKYDNHVASANHWMTPSNASTLHDNMSPISIISNDRHMQGVNSVLHQLERIPLHQRVQRLCFWKRLQSFLLTMPTQEHVRDLEFCCNATEILFPRVHGMIIINLGSELSVFHQQLSMGNDVIKQMDDNFRVLVGCLGQSYRCLTMMQGVTTMDARSTEQTNVVMSLLTQVLYMATSENPATSTTSSTCGASLTLTTLACLDTLLLTPAAMDMMEVDDVSSLTESCWEDDLILLLVKLIATSADECNGVKITNHARNILHKLGSLTARTSSWKVQVAWEALATRNTVKAVETMERSIFYWRCLGQISTDLFYSTDVVGTLLNTVLKHGSMKDGDSNVQLAIDAAECLSDMAKCCERVMTDSQLELKSLWEALLAIVTTSSPLSVAVKSWAVSGLTKLVTSHPSQLTKQLSHVPLATLLQSLCKVVQQGEATATCSCRDSLYYFSRRNTLNAKTEATKLLCYVSNYLNQHFQERRQESILAVRYLSAVIIHNKNATILLEVVQTISQFITDFDHVPKLIDSGSTISDEILSGLAHVIVSPWSSDNATTKNARQTAVLALWKLSQRPTCHLAMVRHSKVLDTLVKEAATYSARMDGGANSIPTTTPIVNLALETLVQLSSNVVNRRLLAKQVGLLACLIRWARHPNSNGQHTVQAVISPHPNTPPSQNRQLLKDCIAHLAAVL